VGLCKADYRGVVGAGVELGQKNRGTEGCRVRLDEGGETLGEQKELNGNHVQRGTLPNLGGPRERRLQLSEGRCEMPK